MRSPYEVIKRPLITEKSTLLKDEENRYFFEVANDANKIEIKKAIETLFNVKVLMVHTLWMKGKKKRLGRFQGRTPNWKKAIATLRKGDSIEFLEGV